MNPLSIELRNKLDRTIVEARDMAEGGAKAALEAIAVHHYEPYGHMSPEDRKLRNHLRARARQLGDKQNRKGELEITHLVWECAYEHWHRMLFARFLAENDLLIEPEMGVAISLEECEELAKEDGKDLWSLASEFAQRMLPQIFRPNDPVLRVTFASEHRLKLEKLLNNLEFSIFTASDSLGWVYQFWQSKRKKEVNQSGNKIGADELPAVTQLFTEPYMVNFLLDNSLGAWWAARRLTEADLQNAESENDLRKKASLPGVPLEYLRFVKQDNGTWTPAAGTFDGWPKNLCELKILDPCCGSGHFLIAALLMLVPIRKELEGLSTRDACDAVLQENLYGLEIDKRCVELAAFALALSTWCYPDAGGYRTLPELNVACSGLGISAKKEEWLALADNTNLRMVMEELYKQFKDGPVLGSLINIEFGLGKGSLFEHKWEIVEPLLIKILSDQKNDDNTEMGVIARGIIKAAELLSKKYSWVITNVPYKKAAEMVSAAQTFFNYKYPEGKKALETVFVLRIFDLLMDNGISSLVLPQNWMFLRTYEPFRKTILKDSEISFIARLGAGAFGTISGEVVKATLFCSKKQSPFHESRFFSIDVSQVNKPRKKADNLKASIIQHHLQTEQKKNTDCRIVLKEIAKHRLLNNYASSFVGLQNGDTPRYLFVFWELNNLHISSSQWSYYQLPCEEVVFYNGRNGILRWENGQGSLQRSHQARIQGTEAWNKKGIIIRLTKPCPCTLYTGELYDQSSACIIPKNEEHLPAIWAYCESPEFREELEKVDQKRNVTNATFTKIPFDLDRWIKIAKAKYPNGIPKPYSNGPTQWIFHGHPAKSDNPLQVAVVRLLDYRWPAELDAGMELANGQQIWVKKCDELFKYVDEDGIVCIPSVRGEETADSKLRALFTAALCPDWSSSVEQKLIRATGTNASNLAEWLRDHFFEQHCKLFHHRPFIWHIWDGRRRDGFHALVNYHKLAEGNGKGRQLLENLTYSYLGEWIGRQKEGVKRGEGGAEERLAAALELQKRLIAIIKGEPPFDIFVRWKPIEEQPIGWEPDINDGVRLNIRPFLAQDIPGGRKGAGILRWKPNINWNKDRGKEPFRSKDQYPWFWKDGEFTGDRVNDIHLTNEEKRQARERMKEEGGRQKDERGTGEAGGFED